MHPEFGETVKRECDRTGTELASRQVFELFEKEYIKNSTPLMLKRHRLEDSFGDDSSTVTFDGSILVNGDEVAVKGEGNGPIDAFFNAISSVHIDGFEFVSYSEHAIGDGFPMQRLWRILS